MMYARILFACGLLAFATTGCTSQPVAPFDTMPQSQVTAYELQNYEPPAAAQAGPGGLMQNLPPQIQQWAQAGGQILQDLGGLGGLIPGLGGGAAGQPAQEAPRFPPGLPREQSFRIIKSKPVMDESLKQELAQIFGSADSFGPERKNCMYAEMGLSWSSTPGAPPQSMLISFSCNEVRAVGFAWPHPEFGLKADTLSELQPIIHKIWAP